MQVLSIDQVSNIKGKKVLLRLDLNVLIIRGEIEEAFRIEKIIPTLRFLEQKGAKIIIISHIENNEGASLEPVARYLFPTFPRLRFLKDINSPETQKEINSIPEGGMVLLENIRFYKGEKENSDQFAKQLASLADMYVNDAFAVSHRAHASVVGVPKYLPSYIGLLFKEELEELNRVFDGSHPFLFILGGAKFETKIPLLKKFLPIADRVFIGGALANDVFKAKGYFVGDSLVSSEGVNLVDVLQNPKVFIPSDVRTQHKGFSYTKKPTEVSVGEKIWDIGPETEKSLLEEIKKASFVLWNGPVGYFKVGGNDGTHFVAQALADSSATTIVGGGDTLAAIDELGLLSKFSFVSTGGGAMLAFLSAGTLVGLDALQTSSHKVLEEKKKGIFSRLFSR